MKNGFARAKVPCLKNFVVFSPGIDAKKEEEEKRMTLFWTLREMYDQKLTEAYRIIWSPGMFELNLKSI